MTTPKTPPPTYEQKARELLNQLLNTPTLLPDYERWNIQGAMPQDSVLLFFSQDLMPSFAPWKDFSCKTIKLVNFDKPAVKITMFLSHKYKIRKSTKFSAIARQEAIQQAIDALLDEQQNLQQKRQQRVGDAVYLSGQLEKIDQTLQQWRDYADHASQYEVAISNYERFYVYHTLNYKYETHNQQGEVRFVNKSEHLIKTQIGVNDTIAETRYNLVFVDPVQIIKEAPYQNKTIHKYLATFTDKQSINNNKDMIYIRRKE